MLWRWTKTHHIQHISMYDSWWRNASWFLFPNYFQGWWYCDQTGQVWPNITDETTITMWTGDFPKWKSRDDKNLSLIYTLKCAISSPGGVSSSGVVYMLGFSVFLHVSTADFNISVTTVALTWWHFLLFYVPWLKPGNVWFSPAVTWRDFWNSWKRTRNTETNRNLRVQTQERKFNRVIQL